MKRSLFSLSLILALILGVFVDRFFIPRQSEVPIIQRVIDRSLDKYSVENLSKANIKPAKLNFDIPNSSFTMEFAPDLGNQTKKVSGRFGFPVDSKKEYPVVVMIRGFVPPEIYKSGVGTQHAAEVFEKNGFITLAPDFLGYGDSDKETDNTFEARFQTYTTIISLLNSVDQIPNWDHKNVFIWAHSNGGQIALTTLEITGKPYPTTLWAPVTAPFPYSILYYSDEGDDFGKALRHGLTRFEEIYDADKYSINNYFDKISKDIQLQLHQGLSDDAVPIKWSDNLNKKLSDLEIKVNYYKYPGTDHNMVPSWNTVVERDLAFFKNNLKN